jgi:glycosyltransferase involved in cell wall biosynthesis
VKEADALHEAGFAVRVVAGDATPGVRPLDAAILARAPWPVVKVGLGPRALHLARRTRQEFARAAFARGTRSDRVTVWAQSAISGRLARAAAAEAADLYIAHCLDALPAAAWAARRHGAKLGFDAEDDHVGELDESPENRSHIEVRRRIEVLYLPHCQHLTAASPGIACAYRDRHGVAMTPILNVFPLAQAPADAPTGRRRWHGDPLSVYWFSQTIGPGRGLEPFIHAMGKMRGRVTLSLRGSDFLGYSARLEAIAADAGVAGAVRFLPPAPPDEMTRLAAHHDVGLAPELCTPPNHAICLSNKIFTYLLAGIPVLLSDTPAQRNISADLGDAARLMELTNPDSIAAALEAWAADSDVLATAKAAAWRLGQTRFNWDLEKQQLLRKVRTTIEQEAMDAVAALRGPVPSDQGSMTERIEPKDCVVEIRTPTFRRPKLLRRALESLIQQNHPRWCCRVFDDDPASDDAKRVCMELNDQRILYESNDSNLGVGGNIDKAFSQPPLPGSTHCCVLEDDNYYLPDLLASNLRIMANNDVDILLRNHLIEVPDTGKVGPRTMYNGQYVEGIALREEFWGTFFYSTGVANAGLFWRLRRGISFSTVRMSDDPIFQERLRTLCLDRPLYIAMDPLVVWRDNRGESTRPSGRLFNMLVRAVARERELYHALYGYIRKHRLESYVWESRFRCFDAKCERVFRRVGISPPVPTQLKSSTRMSLHIKRELAKTASLFIRERVNYRIGLSKIECLQD